MANDFLSGYHQQPRTAFAMEMGKLDQPMSRFLQFKFPEIYDEYLGEVYKISASGKMPTLQFGDFLKKIDWTQKFQSYSPQQRGEYPSRLSPPTRMLNY